MNGSIPHLKFRHTASDDSLATQAEESRVSEMTIEVEELRSANHR